MDEGYFSNTLLGWYKDNKRDLPWRSTKDPYKIWLSEIILQQTRVIQGLPYFLRFEENYPTVKDLASAPEDQVLKDWEGLGYYSRARNMKKAAVKVMEEFSGEFPSSYDKLLCLPGIGEYTAAAVSSFSINQKKAVLDGNVYRFIARYMGIDVPINTPKSKKIFIDILDDLIDPLFPGEFNQAIMEFGALQCKPQNPVCASCPFSQECVAFKENLIDKLPVKIKAKKPVARYFNYFILTKEDSILIRRRGDEDIWAGLYEFPCLETSEEKTVEDSVWLQEIREHWGIDETIEIQESAKTYKNVLSHQIIHARFYFLDFFTENNWDITNLFYVSSKDFVTLAKPKVINLFLNDHSLTN